LSHQRRLAYGPHAEGRRQEQRDLEHIYDKLDVPNRAAAAAVYVTATHAITS
jgi:hypothetical protein